MKKKIGNRPRCACDYWLKTKSFSSFELFWTGPILEFGNSDKHSTADQHTSTWGGAGVVSEQEQAQAQCTQSDAEAT